MAWVKNANYWQDEPGRKSMAVNFELNDAEQLNIERIAIIADELWPVDDGRRISKQLKTKHDAPAIESPPFRYVTRSSTEAGRQTMLLVILRWPS